VDQQTFEGTVTLLFTDVEGSTALTSRTGDAAGRALLRSCEDLIRQQVVEHGGREVKALGDGLMVAFSSARGAIRCAIDIQRALEKQNRASSEGLRVRMGLNAGEAIHEGDDLFGAAVNAASRIAATASGGEILVSEVVKALAGRVPDAGFVERGLVELKGFDERFRLFEVAWKRETQTLQPFERTPFVAREEERAELSSFLNDLEKGHGGVVVIGGEPGVGKTRLTEEIAEQARGREHRVLVGRCYESETAPPYIPFVEIIESAMQEVSPETLRLALGDAAGEVAKIVPQLRTMFDDIPPPLELPAEQERRYLFNSLWEFIERAASVRPLILVLDDVHWADESTLLAAEHIAQRLKDVPALVLATYRDTELDIARPLARTLETLLRRQHAHRLNLKRLPEHGVASLLKVMSGREPPDALVGAIYSETDGNPFFAEEVYKYLAEEEKLFDEDGHWRTDLEIGELDVPEGVKLVIGRRLARLAEPTHLALSIAALIGRRFEYRVLEAVGELGPDELLDAMDEAERARLIVSETSSGEPTFSFSHELIRQTLLGATTLPRKQRRHLAIADALQKLHANDLEANAADIAAHLLRAGSGADPLEAALFLSLAGRRALEAAAFEEALRHYDNALALHPDDKSVGYAQLLSEYGLALRTRGRFEDAFTAWSAAIDLFEAAGEGQAAGNVCREIAIQLGWIGRAAEGGVWAARGLALTDGLEDTNRADLLVIMGVTVSWLGQYEEGSRLIDEGIEMARALGDPAVLGRALAARSLHHFFHTELEEAIRYSEQAGRLLREAGALWDLCTYLPVVAFAYNLSGRFEEAQHLIDEVLTLSERIGHQVGVMLSRRAGEIARGEIDPDRLERKAGEDIVMNRDHDLGWIANGYTWLGAAQTWKGRWDEATDNFGKGAELEVPGAFEGFDLGLLVVHLARLGRRNEVLALFEHNRGTLAVAGERNTIGAIQRTLGFVEATWMIDRRDLCATLYPALRAILSTGLLYRSFDGRTTQLVAALTAEAAGDVEAADRYFEAASAHARAIPFPIEEADAALFQAKSLRARNGPDDEEAHALLDRATELLEGLGMGDYLNLMKKALSLESV
jgi:class 3 adenylate cyclase/tetratricopeptide (TPR) repeat protein